MGNFSAKPVTAHTHCSVTFAALFSGLQQVQRDCCPRWVAWGHWWWLACQLTQQGLLALCLGKAVVIDYYANHPKSLPGCPARCQAAVNKQKYTSRPKLKRGSQPPPWAAKDLTIKRGPAKWKKQAWVNVKSNNEPTIFHNWIPQCCYLISEPDFLT